MAGILLDSDRSAKIPAFFILYLGSKSIAAMDLLPKYSISRTKEFIPNPAQGILKIEGLGKQKNIAIQGTVGNTIYYSLHGKHYQRSKPTRVNRTAASVRSGLNFGKASRICRQVRELVAPLNPCNGDKKLMFRLTGALNQFIHCLSEANPKETSRLTGLAYLRDFHFNDQAIETGLRNFSIPANSNVSGSPGLTIPPFIPRSSIPAPEKTEQILCRIVSTCSNLDRVATKLLGKAEFIIPYRMELYEPPALLFTDSPEPDDLILMIVSLEFQSLHNSEMQTDERLRYRPCGIAWAH